MSKWERVVYQAPKIEIGGECPNCKGPLVFGSIPCPDGISGCCVLHHGYKCLKCGAVWRKVTDDYTSTIADDDDLHPLLDDESNMRIGNAMFGLDGSCSIVLSHSR